MNPLTSSSSYTFRPAKHIDISSIWKIINDAKRYMAAHGSNQWNTHYPLLEHIEKDIQSGEAYVLDINGDIAVYGVIAWNGEPAYQHLTEGQWNIDGDYMVVHRLAVNAAWYGAHLASSFMKEAQSLAQTKGAKSMRIDTREDNRSMIRLLHDLNYHFCGTLIYPQLGERQVYDYRL